MDTKQSPRLLAQSAALIAQARVILRVAGLFVAAADTGEQTDIDRAYRALGYLEYDQTPELAAPLFPQEDK